MASPLPDSNPKTLFGRLKPSVRAIPPSAIISLGLAMEEGERKYGLMNWRGRPVSSSVYYEAALRHLFSWWDGQDVASDSHIHHLAHVMACCAILIDAEITKNLNDDRPVAGGTAEFIEFLHDQRTAAAATRLLNEMAVEEGTKTPFWQRIFGRKPRKEDPEMSLDLSPMVDAVHRSETVATSTILLLGSVIDELNAIAAKAGPTDTALQSAIADLAGELDAKTNALAAAVAAVPTPVVADPVPAPVEAAPEPAPAVETGPASDAPAAAPVATETAPVAPVDTPTLNTV